jgi:DNA polymerase
MATINHTNIQQLYKEIDECCKCSLYKTREKSVPGEGPIDTLLMFIGQSPGKEEDKEGKPFVGRSGVLLSQLLDSSGIRRTDVYITSVLKSHPPRNRSPRRDEIEACKPYLERQLDIINPKIVVLLGVVALKAVLGISKISSFHGVVLRRKDMIYIPTYHPAAALRFPKLINVMKDDFKIIKDELSKISSSMHSNDDSYGGSRRC